MAALMRAHTCIDLIFMDDGHRFDDNLLELYYAHRLLKVGGVLVMHDVWMPSVKKVRSRRIKHASDTPRQP